MNNTQSQTATKRQGSDFVVPPNAEKIGFDGPKRTKAQSSGYCRNHFAVRVNLDRERRSVHVRRDRIHGRRADRKGIERLTRRQQGTFMAPSPQGSKNHLLAFSLGQILEFAQGRFGDLKVMPDVAGGDYKENSRFA